MKRLIKKQHLEVREPLINIEPLYNPLGKGESTEFSDEKSYSKMMNLHTLEEAEKRKQNDKKPIS